MKRLFALLLTAMIALPAACHRPSAPTSTAAACANAELSRIAGWPGSAPTGGGAFRFAVLSDRTGGHIPGLWEQAVEDVNRLGVDFSMSVGDFIEGFTEHEDDLQAQWEAFDAIVSNLRAPFFYCPGNHDVIGENPRKLYTQLHGREGKSYYAFTHCGCRFIVLDSMLLPHRAHGDLADRHWDWLLKELADSGQYRQVFVFSHYPLSDELSWKELRAAMPRPERTMIFAGHYHSYRYAVIDQVKCFVLAGTGNVPPEANRAEGKLNMFALVVMDADGPRVTLVPVGALLGEGWREKLGETSPAEHTAKTQP